MIDHASVSVAVLIPVLGRPERAEPLLRSLAESRVAVPLRPVVLASPDDREEHEAVMAAFAGIIADGIVLGAVPQLRIVDWPPGRGDYARKINLGYRETAEPWILLGADDLRFHPGWAEEAIRVGVDTGCGVIGTNDLGNANVVNGRHATHPLVARWYIDECGASADGPGVVYHEGYGHQYCDTELCDVAFSRGCFAPAPNAVVEHLHPFWGKAGRDATYEKGLASSGPDAALYRRRRRLWA